MALVHQTTPTARPCAPVADASASTLNPGSIADGSRTGYRPAAVAARVPARNAADPRKAASSTPRRWAIGAATRPDTAMSTNGQLQGRAAMELNSSGLTRAVATVPTTNRIATSVHSAAAALAQRCWTAPEVFQRK